MGVLGVLTKFTQLNFQANVEQKLRGQTWPVNCNFWPSLVHHSEPKPWIIKWRFFDCALQFQAEKLTNQTT